MDFFSLRFITELHNKQDQERERVSERERETSYLLQVITDKEFRDKEVKMEEIEDSHTLGGME